MEPCFSTGTYLADTRLCSHSIWGRFGIWVDGEISPLGRLIWPDRSFLQAFFVYVGIQ